MRFLITPFLGPLYLPIAVPMAGLWFGLVWLGLQRAGLIPLDDYSRFLETGED